MTDENKQLIELAQKIQGNRGGSLMEAMIEAERRLTPKPDIKDEFEITLKLKPRVARWVATEFQAYGGHSIEDRLAAYLVTVLNRARTTTLRATEDPAEVGQGGAVTVPRAKFKEDKL